MSWRKALCMLLFLRLPLLFSTYSLPVARTFTLLFLSSTISHPEPCCPLSFFSSLHDLSPSTNSSDCVFKTLIGTPKNLIILKNVLGPTPPLKASWVWKRGACQEVPCLCCPHKAKILARANEKLCHYAWPAELPRGWRSRQLCSIHLETIYFLHVSTQALC